MCSVFYQFDNVSCVLSVDSKGCTSLSIGMCVSVARMTQECVLSQERVRIHELQSFAAGPWGIRYCARESQRKERGSGYNDHDIMIMIMIMIMMIMIMIS